MIVTPPTDDELRVLLSEHAHRHPIKSSITVVGDNGQHVRLPMLLGNPSGACAMPDDVKPSPAWGEMLASALSLIPETPNLGARIAQDAILWPDRATVGQWITRWPALPKKIADLLSQKLAIVNGCLDEPAFDEEPPAAIAKVLAENPRAAWRRMKPTGDLVLHAALVPPSQAPYRIFIDALKAAKASPWAIIRDAAIGGTVALVGEAGQPEDAAATFARWPGLAALVVQEIRGLAGADAKVTLGEW